VFSHGLGVCLFAAATQVLRVGFEPPRQRGNARKQKKKEQLALDLLIFQVVLLLKSLLDRRCKLSFYLKQR
jgi:hypothetical protein